MYMFLMRDEKEEREMSCLGWDSNPRHSTECSTTDPRHSTECSTTELPRQLSWLGPNLTSHDEQANHQLSMKEKAGVMKPPKTPNTKPSIYMYVYVFVYMYMYMYTFVYTCTCSMYMYVACTCRSAIYN